MSEPAAGMMVSTNVRLVRPLGEGGMGAVWVAEHLSLRTQVVVKFMARDLVQSAEAKARFSREAAAASQVKSPHVVQTLDHGVTPEGIPYIVMELLEGRDLEHHIGAAGSLSPVQVVAIVSQLARALTKAHERGIVHRDIKPSNVFLSDSGDGELFVKLLDFGIAKGAEVGIVGSTTRTGTFIGSPYYMSPEQVVGAKDIDFRSDLWSLGVVAFEALTGQRPFFAETVGALALKIHRDPLPVPSEIQPSLPAAIDEWFLRACARPPAERFGSAKEMADALAQAATGASLPPGLKIESGVRRPRGIELDATRAVGDASALFPSPRDARSETGAGVGLASHGSSGGGRGKWVALVAIGVVAIGVGLIAPRLVARTPEVVPPPPIAAAPASAPPLPPGLAALAPVPTSIAPSAPVEAPEPAPAPARSAGATMPRAAAAVPRPRQPPVASAPAPSAAPPSPVPPPAKPPRGSDDDIK